MVLLIGLASDQQRQQTFRPAKRLEVVDLLLVMLVHKSFYRSNRPINSPTAKQGWQCACQPAG